MPELPEVEIVKQGLAPFLTDARIERVILNRAGLRFPFSAGFAEALGGQNIVHVGRRAKYLLLALSSGQTLICHLGMTGNFRFTGGKSVDGNGRGRFEKHDHVVFELSNSGAPVPFLVYSDPRRFGFMALVSDPQNSKFLISLGPEPLGNEFSATSLGAQVKKRKAPIKSVLLDQSVVAGLGNIYVCEALHRAGIDPRTPACDLVGGPKATNHALEKLVVEIRQVLEEALVAGGSTLKDYRNVDGTNGYFQHRFQVYDREGENCLKEQCEGFIERIVQSGRSSFFCPLCQNN